MKRYVRAANGVYNITGDLLMTNSIHHQISDSLRDAIVETDTWVMIDTIDKVWYINHGMPKDLSKSEFEELKSAMARIYPSYIFEGGEEYYK